MQNKRRGDLLCATRERRGVAVVRDARGDDLAFVQNTRRGGDATLLLAIDLSVVRRRHTTCDDLRERRGTKADREKVVSDGVKMS